MPMEDRRSAAGRLLDNACELACAAGLLTMMALTVSEVFSRTVFHYSLQASDEIGGYLLVAITFLAMPVAHSFGTFHHVEFVQARLSRRGKLLSKVIFDLIALAGCMVLDWQLIRFEISSFRSEDVAATLLRTPLWIPQFMMPLGATILCLALLRTICSRSRQLIAGEDR